MKLKNYLFVFSFMLLLISPQMYSQQKNVVKIKGRLIDLKTQNPLESAHIINMSTYRGATSNRGGFFNIDGKINDTIYISMLGYKPLAIAVNENMPKREYTSFYLVPEQYNLSEVVVRSNYLTGLLDVDVRGLNPLFVEEFIKLEGIKKADEINIKAGKPTVMQPIEFIANFFSDEKKLEKIQSSSDIGQMLTAKYDRDFLMKSLNLNSDQLEELLLFCNKDPKWVIKASDLEVLEALSKCQKEMKNSNNKK